MARKAHELTPVFYSTMGSVEKAGDLLFKAALRVGYGPKTHVHGLGDAATWIIGQMQRIFANTVKYLLDFWHVSEYLSAAAEHSWTSEKAKWLIEQKELLKMNKHTEVLKTLRRRLPVDWKEGISKEADVNCGSEIKAKGKQKETPVEACYRYIDNRKDNFCKVWHATARPESFEVAGN